MAPAIALRRNSSPESPDSNAEVTPFAMVTRSRRRGVINQSSQNCIATASQNGPGTKHPVHTNKTKESQQDESTKVLEAVQTLAAVPNLIQKLQNEIQQQNQSIETLRVGQQQLIQQNSALQAQISSLAEQVQKLTQQTREADKSLPPTWAKVAGRGLGIGTQERPIQAKPSPNTLRISTSLEPSDSTTVDNAFTKYMQTDKAMTMITQALQKHSPTTDAQLLGVGSTKTGYLLRFRNETSMEMARKNKEWTEDLGQSTKVVTPRFGVVAHRTPTAEVDINDKENSIWRISQDNGFASKGHCIEEIAWLKKRDLPFGHSATLGIWFNSAEAAEQAIQHGLVFGQSFVSTIEPYQSQQKRCFRCQGLGHMAWNCKEKERCGNCCGQHSRRDCIGTALQCADCGEAHPTGSATCNGTLTPARPQ